MSQSVAVAAFRQGQLELRAPGAGRPACYFLDGREVPEGARLSVQLATGEWIPGIFHWSGLAARWPGLRVALASSRRPTRPEDGPARQPHAVMALHPDAKLRWEDG